MNEFEQLRELKDRIERDLKVCTEPYWNKVHREALYRVNWLLDHYL